MDIQKLEIKFKKESINLRLKNRIWNTLVTCIFQKVELEYGSIKYQKDFDVFKKLYDEVFAQKGLPPSYMKTLINDINKKYSSFTYWYDFYNFLEDIIYVHYNKEIITEFKSTINLVLEQEMSAYRFLEDYITPIIDEVEIKEIEEVFKSKYDSVKVHLAKALEHLSDRESPDYQNSIKESISAVESIVNIVINRKNVALNKGLNSLPFEFDNNFRQGMIKIYSWTSSADGIRHAVDDGEILSAFDEAKYMLVSCSAFINYIISKHEKSTSAKAEDL